MSLSRYLSLSLVRRNQICILQLGGFDTNTIATHTAYCRYSDHRFTEEYRLDDSSMAMVTGQKIPLFLPIGEVRWRCHKDKFEKDV